MKALVLGAGGIRGIAHISLIEFIEKKKINIDIVTGASAGSIVAALYCMGKESKEIFKIIEKLILSNKRELLKMKEELSSKINLFGKLELRRGFYPNDKIYSMLKNVFGKMRFSDCKRKLGIVAFDLENSLVEEITEGYVLDAVVASSCVPGAFDPIRLGGTNFLDGGVLKEIPVELAKRLGANQFIISIIPEKTKFEFKDGLDYIYYLENIKGEFLRQISLNELGDEDKKIIVFDLKYNWFDFERYKDIYNEAKKQVEELWEKQ